MVSQLARSIQKNQASEFVIKLIESNKIDNVFCVTCEEEDIDDYPLTLYYPLLFASFIN